MEQKTAVITGATGGIGKIICKYLANNGYTIFAAYRSADKGSMLQQYLAPELKGNTMVHLIPVNFKSFASVEKFCNLIIDKLEGKKIDLLLNNAGMIARMFETTEDGYESSMQVNYLSAKLITETLLPHISGKIINTISCAITKGEHKEPCRIEAGLLKNQSSIMSLKHYSNSKLMLAQYTIELHKRVGGTIGVYGADPGIVNTSIISMHRWYDPIADIMFRPFIKSPESGAVPLINAIEHNYDPGSLQNYPLLFANDGTKQFPKKIRNLWK